MDRAGKVKYRILIADDSEMNRELLFEILTDEYDIVEVENGAQAVAALQGHTQDFSLLLLDIMMPEMDGFEVLAYMNKYHWIDELPVIMISAETSPSCIARAYDFGVSDYISRPFDVAVVHRRVTNTIQLYAKQRRLVGMVADQIFEKEKSNDLMISILSHIVEFRNGESGLHVLHINTMTELLLNQLVQKTDQYPLTREDISLITTASALHDIGKISVPEEILNKPGRLTSEEFEIIKKHTIIGASMLEDLPFHQNEPLVKVAYEVCRWHHERYDGRGYPDGLKGEEIPISAQIVALADVYDALTSERCYKKAFSHGTAMDMILGGQCGAFNPLLLECLKEKAAVIQKELMVSSLSKRNRYEVQAMTEELLKREELTSSERVLQLLQFERMKYQFLEERSGAAILVYTYAPPLLTMSESSAHRLKLPETIMEPENNLRFREVFGYENMEQLRKGISQASPESPEFQWEGSFRLEEEERLLRCSARLFWQKADPRQPMGMILELRDLGSATRGQQTA